MEHGTGFTEDLIEALGNLRYDVLASFLISLSNKIYDDSKKDKDHNRLHLANCLYKASVDLADASVYISDAWKICEKYMEK